MNAPSRLNRRHFLRLSSVAGAAFSLVPRHVLGGPRFVAPSETVNVAIVGAGGQGRTNVRALFYQPAARVVAVCDPNEQDDYSPFYYRGMAGRKPVIAEIEKHYGAQTPGFRCAEYIDFRKMFEREKGIDAVLCATPDHLHALVSITALRLEKHVYCEKPLTHNIWEARQVARVARETGVATQMGNQGHSGDGILFLGDKGVIMCPGWGGRPRILPDEAMDAYRRPAPTLPRSKGHRRDWLEACKGGAAASANFEYGARITELVLLGNVAVRTRRKIRWDYGSLKATNAPEADALIKEHYRAGWEIS